MELTNKKKKKAPCPRLPVYDTLDNPQVNLFFNLTFISVGFFFIFFFFLFIIIIIFLLYPTM